MNAYQDSGRLSNLRYDSGLANYFELIEGSLIKFSDEARSAIKAADFPAMNQSARDARRIQACSRRSPTFHAGHPGFA